MFDYLAQQGTGHHRAYFINIWKDECSDAEREVLSALATGTRREPGPPGRALQGLYRKELQERANGGLVLLPDGRRPRNQRPLQLLYV